ncbi:N-acetylmuramic acid 6-phosphate etherase [Paenibacillus thalictri]|uniref:N-acetylmuramic acid 6-phosphate etherase n=1 Tax=Paenibacillus thalictri TaxID=2527873 RepID=A0A4Q9DS36_9BACL|nr:N-acetylmuramic acid 6-phosphate etherase [Paenibacillus thalictri]TBL77850.1 N-acetylmuramic acid 6-phosphate etherase [Paenibacillus thalictri]
MGQFNADITITEQRNETSLHIDTLPIYDIVALMNKEDKSVALAVESALPQISAAVEAIAAAVKQGGRLFYIGAGTSGRLGILDASECPPTYGVAPELVVGIIAGGSAAITRSIENAEDDPEAGRRDITAVITAKDVLVGIASSGTTPYVLGALAEAKRIGAITVGLSCNTNTPISAASDYAIEVPVGPEIVTGSTRLKAGTATKMVLNMMSTATMIQLGKVYGNLMVNVQATNAKLRKRVVKIVMEATGADEATAAAYSQEANGDARIAILMLKMGITAEQAAGALEQMNGHFGNTVHLLETQ